MAIARLCFRMLCGMRDGTNPQPVAPAWTAHMQAGQWYRISGDRPDLALPATASGTRYLRDHDPARDPSLNPARDAKERLRRLLGREWLAPWRGNVGFPAITEAWNSAVYASRRGLSGAMVVFGGGHADYYGSDVHAFDLASREWQRLSTGYVGGDAADYGAGAVYPASVYPDGSPLPPHTYDYVQYDAVGNDYLLLKGQTELGEQVKAAPIPHVFNLTTLGWRHGARHPTAVLNAGGCTTWDAGRRLLWGHSGDDGGGNAFVAWCPDGANDDGTHGRWVACHPNKLPGEANHNAMQIEPRADRILLALHARDSLAMLDPNRPAAPVVPVASRGPRPRLLPYAALEYSTRLRALVYCAAGDGARVHGIRWGGGTAVWFPLSLPASLDPVADAAALSRHRVNAAHTFGRFRLAQFADLELALLVRHVDSPVYALRLPG